MKKQIEKIVKQLCKHNINKDEAVNKLLKIKLKLEDMASSKMSSDNIKGLNFKVCNMISSKEI